MAALAELKQKVYQQLEPDDPNSAVPTYQHIQFLAIDSDPTDIAMMRGMARLDKGREFFSINNQNLDAALRAKNLIEGNAALNWMDIDKITNLLSIQGAGGVRQVGRFLLISKAGALEKNRVQVHTGAEGDEWSQSGRVLFCRPFRRHRQRLLPGHLLHRAESAGGYGESAVCQSDGLFLPAGCGQQQAPGGLAARCGQVLQQQRIRGHEGAGLSDEPEERG